jgi:hypothetical protein
MNLIVNQIEQEEKSYFYQKIQDNATPTTIGLQGSYTPILGTRINSELTNFTAEASTLTYKGTSTKKFKLSACFTWEAGGTLNDVYKIAFIKNGSTELGKVEGTLDNSLAWPRNTSLEAIVELATDDTIECLVTNEDGTQSVIIIDMLFVAIDIN